MSDERLRVITGRAAGEALRAAVDAAGGRLVSWRPAQVDCRPERVTAAYRARVRWRTGNGPGRGRRDGTAETFGATVGDELPAGVTVMSDGEMRIGVWRLPHDPDLPGLAAAMDPAAVGRLLHRFGVPARVARIELRSYRPRRRAVVEVTTSAGRLFLKVVRPPRARGLHERHRLVAAAGVPVPESLGWTDSGIVALAGLPGRPLREALRTGNGPWPDVDSIVGLLDTLPAELAEPGEPRAGWAQRAPFYAMQLGIAAPELGVRAGELAAAIVDGWVPGPTVPVHGDFYEQQLMVTDGRLCGLLDLDTAGSGDRLDDLACLLGHLDVLAQVWPRRASTITELGADHLRELDRVSDGRQLRLRVAGVVLSLATGPHRVQERGWLRATERRIDLARRWVERADHDR